MQEDPAMPVPLPGTATSDWPIRLTGRSPPSFQHTYYRDLSGKNPQPTTIVCEPSLYLPRNHVDCVLRYCHRPLRYDDEPPSNLDSLPSTFLPSSPAALFKDLPDGISFVGDRERVRPLTDALLLSLATPQEAYDCAGLDRLSQNLYDVFMVRWNKALWEHDEACFGWGRIDDLTLHAAAKFQACRLANFYLSFAPHFTKKAWENMGGGCRRMWETGPRAATDRTVPDLVLDGIAVLTTSLGCMLSERDMTMAISSTGLVPQRAFFDVATGTVDWKDEENLGERLRKVWLEIFRLFHLYQVRYVLAYNGTKVQLYYLNKTNEVFVSPGLSASAGRDHPNPTLVALLLALAVVPQPTGEDGRLFIPLEPVASPLEYAESNQRVMETTSHGMDNCSQLDEGDAGLEPVIEFPNSGFRLDLSKYSFRRIPNHSQLTSQPIHTAASLKVASHFDFLTFSAKSPGDYHHPSSTGFTVSLGKLISYGHLWNVWDGFLLSHDHKASEATQRFNHWLPVAVKFAAPFMELYFEGEVSDEDEFTMEKAESAILNEASLYEGPLKELQGVVVPRYYGLFESNGVSCMILEKVGDKLPTRLWRSVSRDHREAMLYAYTRLHSQRVLHKDVELRHFCRDLSDNCGAKLRLIDFDGSKIGTDEELKEEWLDVWDFLVGC